MMQQINAAYQAVLQFIEAYRYALVETGGPDNYQKWWFDRFAPGVYGRAPRGPREEDD